MIGYFRRLDSSSLGYFQPRAVFPFDPRPPVPLISFLRYWIIQPRLELYKHSPQPLKESLWYRQNFSRKFCPYIQHFPLLTPPKQNTIISIIVNISCLFYNHVTQTAASHATLSSIILCLTFAGNLPLCLDVRKQPQ